MQLIATRYDDEKTWDYLIGDYHHTRSLSVDRLQHIRTLLALNHNELKLCLKGIGTDEWTKWHDFYGFPHDLALAYDIQRGIIENEVVIESDYPTYEENSNAARIIGAIIEGKGFIPHYYYSGSKSIHIHIYFDWTCMRNIDEYVAHQLLASHSSANVFKKKFMEWLRTLMVGCWGIKARQFDEQLIKASHLIRCEGSKNKRGFKTFIGYTYRDLPPFPIICSPQTGIVAEIGELQLSRPPCVQETIEEYLHSLDKKAAKLKEKRKERALDFFMYGPEDGGAVKGCCQFMLSDEFKTAGDGFQRAMFLLSNELKRKTPDQAPAVLLDWNARMGEKVSELDIMYRLARSGTYDVSHETIHTFLRQLGFKDIDGLCEKKQAEMRTNGKTK
jgi:hypothetical protein